MAAFRVSDVCGAVILILVLGSLRMVDSLECYKCASVEFENKDKSTESYRKGIKSDPNCESAGYETTATETCPDSFNYRCGLIKAEVSVNLPLVPKFSVRTLARQCMEANFDGCDGDASKVMEGAGQVLNFLSVVPGDVEASGKLCYCSFDRCVAGGCVSGEVPIGGQCVAWYFVAIGVGVVVVVGLLVTCCCCRCCTSCRPKGGMA